MRSIGQGVKVLLLAAAIPAVCQASYQAPAGYTKVPLNITSGAMAVSSTGRLVTVDTDFGSNSLQVKLYDTWQNGRTLLKSATFTPGGGTPFSSTPVFVDDNTVIVGDNGVTGTIYSIDFSAANPAFGAPLATNNTFPSVQGLGLTADKSAVLVSGDTFDINSNPVLYLKKLVLSNNAVSTFDNTGNNGSGSGYPGGTGASNGGSNIQLDSDGNLRYFGASALTKVVSLFDSDPNAFGAYGIAFEPNPGTTAYVTTGGSITKVAGIDDTSPTLSAFGTGGGFLADISYAGGLFRANT
ncbi:MAG TPA: hypothetical protein VIL86_00860, partial [Tepidisphaeraceae bacterium]